MDEVIIMPELALNRMKVADKRKQHVYVCGATMFGKTSFVKAYLANRKYTYVSCMDASWNTGLLPEKTENIVVVDDLQFLASDKRQELELFLQESGKRVIMISRGYLPMWLGAHDIAGDVAVISEELLELNVSETLELAKKNGFAIGKEDAVYIRGACKGAPYLILYYFRLIRDGACIGYETDERIKVSCAKYIQSRLIPQWPDDLRHFLIMLSEVPAFTEELASMVTGEANAGNMIMRAREIGSLIVDNANGDYCFRPYLLYALRKTASEMLTAEEIRMLKYNAGLYYEMHGQLAHAAEMYQAAGYRDRLKGVLDKNVRLTPNAGFYYELREYYMSFTHEEAGSDPILLAGISMTYSIFLQPEKSEEWYEVLKALCKRRKNDETEIWLLYLDICLPHRVNTDVLAIVKTMPKIAFNKSITMPAFAVTSNMPGIMNGGLDLSSWSKMDRELKVSIGWILEKMCGDYGKGLTSAALAESLYERGEDLYEIMSLISRAQVEAENGGKPDILFAMMGVTVRMNILRGNVDNAELLTDSFINRNRNANPMLLSNAEALRIRLAVFLRDERAVRDWIEKKAPCETDAFFTMERYRYLTKARAYIMLGELHAAYSLLDKMIYYTERYNRKCMLIESLILMSITKERLQIPWQAELIRAVKIASDLNFSRLFSEEGIAILPLLKKIARSISGDPVLKAFMKNVQEEAEQMARRYPDYLSRVKRAVPKLTDKGLEVLKLQAENIPRDEIAERLHVSVDDVKYHIRQNYKKLGVNNKTDAVLAAYNWKLI